MQIYAYDTIKAKQLGIVRDPAHDLKHRGWEGVELGQPDADGIILLTAETVKIDILNPPKHITPVVV
jgi:hypothetical protein